MSTGRLAVRPRTVLAMHPDLPAQLFGADFRSRIEQHVDLADVVLSGTVPDDDSLADVEILIGCWGAPQLDTAALKRMPRLRACFYAAGTVKDVMTDEAFDRGIVITTAAEANAVAVAEYTLAAILFGGKRVLPIAEEYRRTGRYPSEQTIGERWGNYGLRVGIVGASRIGRRVIELLAPFDVEVLVYDPVTLDDIPGVTRVGLDELLSSSDVVSIHAPATPETEAMIDRSALSLLRDGATLINTARGSIVDNDALADELEAGRLSAIIDTTEPFLLPPEHRLHRAPNTLLTPHIAGSQGHELRRLGDAAIGELRRWLADVSLQYAVARHTFSTVA